MLYWKVELRHSAKQLWEDSGFNTYVVMMSDELLVRSRNTFLQKKKMEKKNGKNTESARAHLCAIGSTCTLKACRAGLQTRLHLLELSRTNDDSAMAFP